MQCINFHTCLPVIVLKNAVFEVGTIETAFFNNTKRCFSSINGSLKKASHYVFSFIRSRNLFKTILYSVEWTVHFMKSINITYVFSGSL